MQKPYYNLDFGATMCKLQIKVNNFEVFMLNINGNTVKWWDIWKWRTAA